MRPWRLALLLTPIVAILLLGGAGGCSQILGFGDYKVGPADATQSETGPEAGDDGGCTGDTGCYSCPPQTNDQLQNACTGSQCVPFDEPTRISGYTGKLPDVPDQDAGTNDGSTPTVDAGGLPTCDSIGKPVVYITGTAKPLVQALGGALFNDGVNNILVAYRGQLSCPAFAQISPGNPNTGIASYWTALGSAEQTCAIPTPESGTASTDIGISDVFAETCGPLPGGLPNGVADVFGPVQAVAFIVPKGSSQKSISADGAYYVYGLGAQSGEAPWTDEGFIYRRDATSGTSLSIWGALGLYPTKWRGVDPGTSTKMINAITSSTAPEKTLGLAQLVNVTATQRQQQLNELAFKARGQSCAYYPDSSATSNDKKNVRDGHYFLWGPAHFFVHVNPSTGQPLTPIVGTVLGMLTGTVKPPGALDLISVEAGLNLVPSCAMQVQRTRESGPLTPFAPKNACGCYFDQVSTGSSDCKTCTIDQNCPAEKPVCSYGFCEAQ